MAISGVLVIGAGVVLVLAVLGVIALLSRGEAVPAIAGIVVIGCLLAGVGAAAYVFIARSAVPATVRVAPAVPEAPVAVEVDVSTSPAPPQAIPVEASATEAEKAATESKPGTSKKEEPKQDDPQNANEPNKSPQ